MFTAQSHSEPRKDRRLPAGDSPATKKKGAELNPTWQVLALQPHRVQTKLAVSRAGDPEEREADRVADQVMRGSFPQTEHMGISISRSGRKAQRKCGPCEEEEEKKIQRKAVPGSSQTTVAAPIVGKAGRQLDSATRAFMEPRFNRDFGNVRIHADDRADNSARKLNALAFTLGRDVAFRSGQYAPNTETGRRLLAHELAHVVQQGEGPTRIQRSLTVDNTPPSNAQDPLATMNAAAFQTRS